MGNCIYNTRQMRQRPPHIYLYKTSPQPLPQPQKDELQLPDFVSEQSDYDAFIRFHKYPEDVIIRSDVLCYRVEVAREQLLWYEIQFFTVKRAIRHLLADIQTVNKMDAISPCEHTFGINPLTVLDEQLQEHYAQLDIYRANIKQCQQRLNRRYDALMRFWDKEYITLCRGER